MWCLRGKCLTNSVRFANKMPLYRGKLIGSIFTLGPVCSLLQAYSCVGVVCWVFSWFPPFLPVASEDVRQVPRCEPEARSRRRGGRLVGRSLIDLQGLYCGDCAFEFTYMRLPALRFPLDATFFCYLPPRAATCNHERESRFRIGSREIKPHLAC